MLEEALLIPEERIAVLIGKKGSTKRQIERDLRVRIDVGSGTGEIEVRAAAKNAINFYIALNIIKAIARGFSPEHAFLLKKEEFYLEVLDLRELLGKNEKTLAQKRGRVIGRAGRVREKIEQETGCFVAVYGKTISIIGRLEGLEKTLQAIEMLLEGAAHSTVERFLSGRASRLPGKGFEL